MAATRDRETYILLAIAIVALLALVYSVFVTRALLQWVGLVLPLVFLYLVWRFVRAHERIATALESMEAVRNGGDTPGRDGTE